MQESKDHVIKLFGQKIHLPADGEISTISANDFDKAKCGNRVVVVEEEEEEEDEEEKEKTEQVGQFNKILRLLSSLLFWTF